MGGDSAYARTAHLPIEQAVAHLDGLSTWCGVIGADVGAALRGLLEELAAAAGLISAGQESDGAARAARRHYLELLGLLIERVPNADAATSLLSQYIVERLLRDDHQFLRHAASKPWTELHPEVVAVMRSDLEALECLARSSLGEWVERLAGFVSHPSSSTRNRGQESSPQSPSSDGGCRDSDPWDMSAVHRPLKRRLVETDSSWPDLLEELAALVWEHGAGSFQGSPAFRLVERGSGIALRPVRAFSAFDLEWLEGNESRIEIVDGNTRNLLDGFQAHNVLIWGPRGCGKSSLIRGLVTRYYSRGLRAIEIQPESLSSLPELYAEIRHRRQYFIGVLDNLSLERKDPNSRILSTALDGGFESRPENFVLYATSNYKDLVDREGERPKGQSPHSLTALPSEGAGGPRPQPYDPQQFERLDGSRAVDDRFPLKVFMDSPRKSECDRMVISYARRAGIEADEEELLAAFNVWRMRHNHDLVGGRTARDFVLACLPDFARAHAVA